MKLLLVVLVVTLTMTTNRSDGQETASPAGDGSLARTGWNICARRFMDPPTFEATPVDLAKPYSIKVRPVQGGEGLEISGPQPARDLTSIWDRLPVGATYEAAIEARRGDGMTLVALARGLGNAISLLNSERIILGGRFVQAGDLLLNTLRQKLASFTLRELAQGIEIRTAELGEGAAFAGIASHVRERLFVNPSVGAALDAPAAAVEVA